MTLAIAEVCKTGRSQKQMASVLLHLSTWADNILQATVLTYKHDKGVDQQGCHAVFCLAKVLSTGQTKNCLLSSPVLSDNSHQQGPNNTLISPIMERWELLG